jgi:magnesium-transporting ATPase (P-type)
MTVSQAQESPSSGLTSAAAAGILAAVGRNRLPDPPRRGMAHRAGDQLRDPMILLLIGAAGLTTYLHDWPNTVIILAVVVFNTTGNGAAGARRKSDGGAAPTGRTGGARRARWGCRPAVGRPAIWR